MEMQQLNDLVRGQIKDTTEPYIFAKEVEEPVKADELEQFVMMALQDYSGFKPLRGKPGTISLIIGQKEYELPSDFLEMDEFPLEHHIFNQVLYLKEIPTVTEPLEYFYVSVHGPETVPQTDVPCIVWSASASALRALVTDQKRLEQYVSYKVPDMIEVNADKVSEIGKALLKNASDMEVNYLKRVQRVSRPSGPYVTFG